MGDDSDIVFGVFRSNSECLRENVEELNYNDKKKEGWNFLNFYSI